MKYMIYALKDPLTKSIRYIGKSCKGLNRPKEHLFPHQNKLKTHKNCWVRSLLKKGLKPEIIILEECDRESLDKREIFWIDYHKKHGYELTNMTNGGTGGNTGGAYKKHKPVISINTITHEKKRYSFVWQASLDGFSATKVVSVCKGKRHSHKGYYFHYENEVFVEPVKKTMRPILCENRLTGEKMEFKSIQEASRKTGLCLHTISTALNGKTRCRKYEFVNASHVNERYEPVNTPVRIIL